MARPKNNTEKALIQIWERENKKGVRFYLRYTIDGKREAERMDAIPFVQRSDKLAYKEARMKAEAICQERIMEMRTYGLGYKTRQSNLLLSDYLNTLADKHERRVTDTMNRHTWSRMLRHTAIILNEFNGDTKISSVDKVFILKFIDYLQHEYKTARGEHLAPKTAHKYFTCVRYALNEAVRNDIIQSNPCEKISKNDKIKVPESTREFLTAEEVGRLIDTPTTSKVRNVFLFMCCTGLRISDAKSLRWSDIKTDSNGTRISKVMQKTQKPIEEPLSEQAQRFLPARGTAAADEFVFSNLPTEPAMNRALKSWCKNAGIEKNVTLHVARHSFATLMITEGVDLYTTSNLLGHTDVKTTKIYAKIVDEKKTAAVNKLNNLF